MEAREFICETKEELNKHYFESGHWSMIVTERSESFCKASNSEIIDKFHDLVMGFWRLKVREIANDVVI